MPIVLISDYFYLNDPHIGMSYEFTDDRDVFELEQFPSDIK